MRSDVIRAAMAVMAVVVFMALVLILPVGGYIWGKGADPAELKKVCSFLQPEEILKIISDPRARKPVLVHVGFRNFYRAAHIPGSRFAGPASDPGGVELLKKEAAGIPRDEEVVLYCGCCPMNHCPNIRPACTIMRDLGFTKVRVLELQRSFEHDWIDRGYPVERDAG